MEKLAVLNLDGDLEQGFKVTLEIYSENQQFIARIQGQLPPAPGLADALYQWCDSYRNLGLPSQRIKLKKVEVGFEYERFERCRRSANELNDHLVHWLNSEAFLPIDRRLRKALSGQDVVRVLVRAEDQRLQQLPWHQWHFFQDYPCAEYALSHLNAEQINQPLLVKDRPVVKILAILGDATGINLEADRQFLEQLQLFDAEVKFLQEPRRQEFSNQLWEQPWDILFFAGHSRTEGNKGWIDLNAEESLSLDELKGGLRRAIAHGLQLAIFNSCDGLGLARELEHLHIPQLIVMRQPVPDRIAHRFLHLFLNAYVGGKSLYLAVREARERLEENLQEATPCASWLPVIYQNAAEVPPTWERLRTGGRIGGNRWRKKGTKQQAKSLGQTFSLSTDAQSLSKHASKYKTVQFKTVSLISFAVMLFIIGMRWFGVLQSLELQTFDQFMRFVPSPVVSDRRLLIIDIREEDIVRRGNEYPLHDETILELLQKLQYYQPKVIGLHIYRDRPVGKGQVELINYLDQSQQIVPICTFQDEPFTEVKPPPIRTTTLIGFDNIIDDPDAVVRRQLIAKEDEHPALEHINRCQAEYSFSFQLALRYLWEKPGAIPLQVTGKTINLAGTALHPINLHTGFYHNIDARGFQILLNYPSQSVENTIDRVTLTEVMADRVNPNFIKNKIVLIGMADSSKRVRNTPHQPRVDTILLQAQMINHLLNVVEGKQLLLHFIPIEKELIYIYFCAIAGGLVVKKKQSYLQVILSNLLLFMSIGIVCLGALVYQGSILPFIPCVLAFMATQMCIVYVTLIRVYSNP